MRNAPRRLRAFDVVRAAPAVTVAIAVTTVASAALGFGSPAAYAQSVQGAGPFAAQADDDEVISSISPERFASILQDLGYRAAVSEQSDKKKIIRTGMAGYKVVVWFYECSDDQKKCRSIQYQVGFDKDPTVTLSRINNWNFKNRYSKLYVDESDGTIEFEYDLFTEGVTMGSLKRSVGLCDKMVGDLRRFMRKE